ncbi:unnamed protein product, partial [Hapterophycus canaliculatus]
GGNGDGGNRHRGGCNTSCDVDDALTQQQSDDVGGGNGKMAPHATDALHDELNESQRDAVFAEVGAVRVVAGPGSGKTRVLTHRIAHLVRNVGAPASSIFAVTFTIKASEEMRLRVRKALGARVSDQVTVGTFHGVCAKLLRRHGKALKAVVPGLTSSFKIIDTEDSHRRLTDAMKDMCVDFREYTPRAMLSVISKLKNEGVGPEDMGQRAESEGLKGAASDRTGTIAEVYALYQSRLVQANALDFDDIILVALRLLQQDAEVFRAVGRQYRHIVVDEWQDTNGPQYDIVLEIVRAGREAELAREENAWRAAQAEGQQGDNGDPPPLPPPPPPPPSIFVVGDTDQCIYKFRGADYTNVTRFVKDFDKCQTVLLRQNYRSTANIARAASAVIARVSGRLEQPTTALQV